MREAARQNEISAAILGHFGALFGVGVFSFAINFLYLTPSLYMLQVYDRVVTSRSDLTLLSLSLLVVGLYAVMAGLEFARSQVLIRVGNAVDVRLSHRIFTASFESILRAGQGTPSQALTDLSALRQFLTGQGLFAFLDAPWIFIYLIVIFLLHPMLGWFALGGSCVLILLAGLTEVLSRGPLGAANKSAVEAANFANTHLRNAEAIEAMGMLQALRERWWSRHVSVLVAQTKASNRAASVTAAGKLARLILQSGALGLGALLVIRGEATPGVMIAASILTGRALAPVELLIGTWKGFSSARGAYRRLGRLLETFPRRPETLRLPPPVGAVTLENVFVTPPDARSPVIKGVSLAIQPGEIVGVIGPTSAGKSSLARVIAGIWPTQVGKARLDGADVHLWDKQELGPHVGFLPQDIELFSGTIAENIARFGVLDSECIVDAARRAGIHEAILRMAQGYDTPIGDGGGFLSGGQRQRIALARALYGRPKLLILDEPNSNLDDAGEAALITALRATKEELTTAIVITHRTNVLQSVDKLLLLNDGVVQAFGPRDEVLQALSAARQAAATGAVSNRTPEA